MILSTCISSLANRLLRGILHPKILILSSFPHPKVVPNLYELFVSAECKRRYFQECG